jgi:hypothetical protein
MGSPAGYIEQRIVVHVAEHHHIYQQLLAQSYSPAMLPPTGLSHIMLHVRPAVHDFSFATNMLMSETIMHTLNRISAGAANQLPNVSAF